MTRSKSQRAHQSLAQEVHDTIEADMPPRIPDAWHTIWREVDRRADKRVKVTLTLDADVVRFFRSMGARYQPRINRVLRAFMHDRLAGLVDGPEDRVTAEDLARLERQSREIALLEMEAALRAD